MNSVVRNLSLNKNKSILT